MKLERVGRLKLRQIQVSVQSSIDDNQWYDVEYSEDTQQWICRCPSFIYRGGICKHIERLRKMLEVD